MASDRAGTTKLPRTKSAQNGKGKAVARKSAKPNQLGPSSRDKEARMDAMIDAAVALFSEEGYAAVSTRRIAERAGCSETLLFRYFGDKRGLLMVICNSLGADERQEDPQPELQDVRDFIEHYLISELHALKRQASSLKVVIAALINDPEMTADFEKKHDEAVNRVASGLRRFQETGALATNIDIESQASAIEQLGFALGFLLQLVFNRPEAELIAIAKSSAAVLSLGLQAEASEPVVEPRRRKAIATVLDAWDQLDSIIAALGDPELKGTPNSRNGARPTARARK